MVLFSARHSSGGTPHSPAAASTSISLAAAPALRKSSQELRTLRLPPVTCRLVTGLTYSGPAGACSTRIADQSASSSSAISIGIDVRTPWPMSDLSTIIVTTLWGGMGIGGFGAKGSGGGAGGGGVSPRGGKPIAGPAPAATPAVRKVRRLSRVPALIARRPR